MKHGNAALALAGLALATVGFAGGWMARGGSNAVVEPPPAAVDPAPGGAASAEPSADAPVQAAAPAETPPEPQPAQRRRSVRLSLSEMAGEPAPAAPKSQEELLASVGFSADRVRELRERSARFEQAREYLDKEARREESAASLELARAQKKEIGEEAYGYMLWSAGIPNRVVVEDVFEDSNASRAGLQRGDVVLRYDGERIFETDEIGFLVREPSSRTRAELEILRNGELIEVSVPRGVIGIRAGSSFDPPRQDLRRRRMRGSVVSGDRITVNGDEMTVEGNVTLEPAEKDDR